MFIGWKLFIFFLGDIVFNIVFLLICFGNGSWIRILWIDGFLFKWWILFKSFFLVIDMLCLIILDVILIFL